MSTFATNIDLAEVLFTLFWVFFIGLIIYLRREDKREGYPLNSDRGRSGRVQVQGFPAMPKPKTFKLAHGGTVQAPSPENDDRNFAMEPASAHLGAPAVPTGDPMVDGIGPASYPMRADTPDLTMEGEPRVVPMRVAPDFVIHSWDADPRGMTVLAADGGPVGEVTDCWVDRSEPQIFYLEVALGERTGGKHVLLPMAFADIRKSAREVRVRALYPEQFVKVPGLRNPDQITLLEEEKVTAFYAGGIFYADPGRQEPVV